MNTKVDNIEYKRVADSMAELMQKAIRQHKECGRLPQCTLEEMERTVSNHWGEKKGPVRLVAEYLEARGARYVGRTKDGGHEYSVPPQTFWGAGATVHIGPVKISGSADVRVISGWRDETRPVCEECIAEDLAWLGKRL